MTKTTSMMLLVAAALVTPHASLAGPSAASPEMKRAFAKAEQGPDDLRRFIHRTRMIYALDFDEVVAARDAQKADGTPASVASAAEPRR